jgi:hypothetical protein
MVGDGGRVGGGMVGDGGRVSGATRGTAAEEGPAGDRDPAMMGTGNAAAHSRADKKV